ncbi:CaiB/BaiF CoA transferase family protein [Rhodococcus chondri]|uniref:CaiB/BaiF CoA-transferase family protein n=1 Tax=Rhodococcus chondri TaxID=3065941 RepID=A0ABU7JSZ0_9NOCA|nr:CaiB/BaiF CoA-transferase family protein [Rhodococcus sp. CC-R104]MEE2033024.1 CaiB/BaiF CoA-transferase family protein [Rhodococcus sp. CC-R104]
MTQRDSTGPLAGLTVLELAGIGPAPFACMHLADMGATVIRVDRPSGGETAGPPPEEDLLNRGKQSVVLDLKQPSAVEAFLTLVETADVVVEGFRPGVAERLGIGPDAVWARNPKVVYGRMTGWGQFGPLAHTAGHDLGYIAVTGALHAIGTAGGPPQIPLNLVGDFGGGSAYLVIGILAALREAELTGRGQVVDAAIVDGASHLLAGTHALLATERWTDERGVNLLDGGAPFYSVYETSDGRYMAVGSIESKFYAELLRLLELDEDPRAQNDRDGWPALRKRLAEVFQLRTQSEWTEIFAGTDACVAPVLSLRESAHHVHLAERGTIVAPDGVLQPGFAPRFSAHSHPTEIPLPPALGEHTRAVLTGAGVNADGLIAEGVAAQA